MKIAIISDIHGISKNLDYLKKRFRDLKCDKLIVLGDLLSGPNYLESYNPKTVINFLNEFRDKIICLKGNCDYHIDVSQFDFEINPGLVNIKIDNYNFYLNHGHLYNYDNLKDIQNGILIYGHEHKPYIRKVENVLCLNPGSISIPRTSFLESYLYYDNGKFTIYDIDNQIIDEYNLKAKN